jgi:hypothetical protein
MKKTADHSVHDDLRTEYRYDYKKARPNRFAERVSGENVMVVLDPDVAEVFSSSEDVNTVLRALIQSMPKVSSSVNSR